jgi:hypothetical protein
MQAHSARAGCPLAACRVQRQRRNLIPGLAPVFALEQNPGIAAGPNDARLIGVAGTNVPHALERLTRQIPQFQSSLGEMPRLPAVLARMDMRAEPRAVDRRIMPPGIARVLHHVVHLPAAKMRTLNLPRLSILAAAGERAFARPEPDCQMIAHSFFILIHQPRILESRVRSFLRRLNGHNACDHSTSSLHERIAPHRSSAGVSEKMRPIFYYALRLHTAIWFTCGWDRSTLTS